MPLRALSLTDNDFAGPLYLADVPGTMEMLNLSTNAHTGEIHLESLPGKVNHLSLSGNRLTGPLNLTSLPPAMEIIISILESVSGRCRFGTGVAPLAPRIALRRKFSLRLHRAFRSTR